ncbi:MAG TPA: hypothetical protein VFS24_10320 [Steroidobacteraceae bacterium]|nr:hypothetical protein [Steroidobacteraceae bacterium]
MRTWKLLSIAMPRTHTGLLRQQFIAGLFAARRVAPGLSPLARVLRRAREPHAHYASYSINVLVRLSQHAASMHREVRSEIERHERVHTVHTHTLKHIIDRQRMLERRVFESRMSAVPGASAQLTVRERIERSTLFERLPMAFAPTRPATTKQTVAPQQVRGERARPMVDESMSPMAAQLTPASLPANELARVTDHVIKQLDRRVLSYRERTGRI